MMARQRGFRVPTFEHFMNDVESGAALRRITESKVHKKIVTTLRELDASSSTSSTG